MDTTRASLLLRIKNRRDAAAWAEFDSIYRPMLQRYASARGLPQDEVLDVVQQCMIAIHKHIERFDYDPKKGRFKGWLKTMVSNRVKNCFRDRRASPGGSREMRLALTPDPGPEEVFDKVWLEEHLRHAIACMKSEVDETSYGAFQAYVVEERPVEEVCRKFDISASRLYKIKWRMTRKLSDRMAELTCEEP